MRANGVWVTIEGQIPLPVIRVKIVASDGELVEADLVIDTGAENTVLTAALVREVGLAGVPSPYTLTGVGGSVPALVVRPELHFMTDDGGKFAGKVQCFAFATDNPLDASILGRDLLKLFRVILDFQSDLVCLLAGNHRYVIQES